MRYFLIECRRFRLMKQDEYFQVSLDQRSQTRGPRAACGPPEVLVRPATSFINCKYCRFVIILAYFGAEKVKNHCFRPIITNFSTKPYLLSHNTWPLWARDVIYRRPFYISCYFFLQGCCLRLHWHLDRRLPDEPLHPLGWTLAQALGRWDPRVQESRWGFNFTNTLRAVYLCKRILSSFYVFTFWVCNY